MAETKGLRMHCAIPYCDEPASTIYRGFALCAVCYGKALRLPHEQLTPVQMERILMAVRIEDTSAFNEQRPSEFRKVVAESLVSLGVK